MGTGLFNITTTIEEARVGDAVGSDSAILKINISTMWVKVWEIEYMPTC